MDATEFFAFLASLIISLGIIVTIVALGTLHACLQCPIQVVINRFPLSGWFCVWKFFLCRFRLVRELLGTANEGSSNSNGGSSTYDRSSNDGESKLNGRRDSRKGTTVTTAGAYKSTRSRSRKED